VLHIPDATLGTSPISVIAGGQPTTIDFEVVDHADSASLIPFYARRSFTTGQRADLCFQARNAGRYIAGLKWTITVTGELNLPVLHMVNCVALTPQQTSGEITVTAAAAGQSVSLTLPVVAQ